MSWSMWMEVNGERAEGLFLARDNRFRVTIEIAGQRVAAHLPNSGRLGELLVAGRRVVVIRRHSVSRSTQYDLSLVELDGTWVSLDARLPNDLIEEALQRRQLAYLRGYHSVRREVSFGHSRLDFLLEATDRPPCLVEVKSATLVVDGLACFPDAVTQRGRRHLDELAAAVERGYRAAVVFVVQRSDAWGLRPHDESDPRFGEALRAAVERGVEAYAHACHVEPGRVEIDRALPVYLDARRPV